MRIEKGGNTRLTSSRSLKLLVGAGIIAVFLFLFSTRTGASSQDAIAAPLADVREQVAIFETEHGMLNYCKKLILDYITLLSTHLPIIVLFFSDWLGRMVWRFFPEHAPITVANIKKMVELGHYNNSHFYRAQRQFCLQGGLWNLRPAPFSPIKLEYKYVTHHSFNTNLPSSLSHDEAQFLTL